MNAKPVPTLTTSKGDSIEQSMVIDMLEAQHGGTGFASDVWLKFGWRRAQWQTAMDLLHELGLITKPTRGKQTMLLTDVSHAIDVVKGMR